MGFRVGWWGKWGGITAGRSGLRLYGILGGRNRKSGCLIPFVMLVAVGALAIVLLIRLAVVTS